MEATLLRNKATDFIEKNTIERLVKPKEMDEKAFVDSLFDESFYNDDFYSDVNSHYKEMVAARREEYEREMDEQIDQMMKETERELAEELKKMDGTDQIDIPVAGVEDGKELVTVKKAEVVEADELSPDVVEFITASVIERMQKERGVVINDYMSKNVATQEEFFKIQLLGYFPVIGVLMYLAALVCLSANRRNRYNISMQNFAKAELKTFWMYLIAHASVIFVAVASMTSLINIIQRGLAA